MPCAVTFMPLNVTAHAINVTAHAVNVTADGPNVTEQAVIVTRSRVRVTEDRCVTPPMITKTMNVQTKFRPQTRRAAAEVSRHQAWRVAHGPAASPQLAGTPRVRKPLGTSETGSESDCRTPGAEEEDARIARTGERDGDRESVLAGRHGAGAAGCGRRRSRCGRRVALEPSTRGRGPAAIARRSARGWQDPHRRGTIRSSGPARHRGILRRPTPAQSSGGLGPIQITNEPAMPEKARGRSECPTCCVARGELSSRSFQRSRCCCSSQLACCGSTVGNMPTTYFGTGIRFVRLDWGGIRQRSLLSCRCHQITTPPCGPWLWRFPLGWHHPARHHGHRRRQLHVPL